MNDDDIFSREKNVTSRELSLILREKCLVIKEQNVALRKRKTDSLTFLEHQYKNSRYDIYRKLSEDAREIGYIADINALNYIFPACRQKPYGIRTLSALQTFLKDTETTETHNLAIHTAIYAWFNTPCREKTLIRGRLINLLKNNPNLVYYIETLKNSFFYEEDDDVITEAKNACSQFIADKNKPQSVSNIVNPYYFW
jgi:hypothetical protein